MRQAIALLYVAAVTLVLTLGSCLIWLDSYKHHSIAGYAVAIFLTAFLIVWCIIALVSVSEEYEDANDYHDSE